MVYCRAFYVVYRWEYNFLYLTLPLLRCVVSARTVYNPPGLSKLYRLKKGYQQTYKKRMGVKHLRICNVVLHSGTTRVMCMCHTVLVCRDIPCVYVLQQRKGVYIPCPVVTRYC